MLNVLPFVILGLIAADAAHAQTNTQEGFSLLMKMANASRQLNYSGTFVYQHGGKMETSRIVHYVNTAGGEFEKLEALDGPPREVIRNNDQLTCYLPNQKTVIIEQRSGGQLPVLVPERLSGIVANYTVKLAEKDRVAGYDCRVVVLEPKDKLRYGRSFCAEVTTGLPLRTRTINEKHEAIESFAFTQLTIGGNFNRDKVKSKYAAMSKNWRIDRSSLIVAEQKADTGWIVGNQPAGFKKMTEISRSIAGRPGAVSHIVLSDGISAVSVFIESKSRERVAAQALAHQGAVNIYTRLHDEHVVTVLGEAPAATVMQIANSLELRAQPAAPR